MLYSVLVENDLKKKRNKKKKKKSIAEMIAQDKTLVETDSEFHLFHFIFFSRCVLFALFVFFSHLVFWFGGVFIILQM